MPDTAKRRLVMTITVFSVMVCSYAQPRTLGSAFSYNGISLVYEHVLSDECFITTDLRAELGEVFINKTDIPGISASVTADFILKSWLSANGNPINMFAGPGAAIGVASDYHLERGVFFGLKGRIGVECFFSRKVSISASLKIFWFLPFSKLPSPLASINKTSSFTRFFLNTKIHAGIDVP